MIRISELRLPVLAGEGEIRRKAASLLRVREDKIRDFTILRRSIDARKRGKEIRFSYTVLLSLKDGGEERLLKRLGNPRLSLSEQKSYRIPALPERISGKSREEYFSEYGNRPRIVGFGPAGMFAGLLLARMGACPLIYERGGPVEEREKAVLSLWKDGRADLSSNPQFGEGGAGTFSDGKLNTLVKDPDGRSRFVLSEFVRAGAPEEILIDGKPHIGTDLLLAIVRNIREEILSLGGEIRFHSQYHFRGEESSPLILAIGHSARDSYRELLELGLSMRPKDFAMGFRIQHPQALIDRALYGEISEEMRKALGPGAYKLSFTNSSGRALYSFCMCPGGYVINASSEEGGLCVNGMSCHSRDSGTANSAIVMAIRKEDYGDGRDPMSGILFQRELEERCFRLCGGRIPMQRYGAFRDAVSEGERERDFLPEGLRDGERDPMSPAFRGLFSEADLSTIFRFGEDSPYRSLNCFNTLFIEGVESFSRRISGFNREDAVLCALESRTSSPIRIPRDEDFHSNLRFLYPCGEGAGYAGGIMSAAMDGMKTAEALSADYCAGRIPWKSYREIL